LRRALAALALAVFALEAGAAPPFELPLACVPGESCWIVNYVDEDASPAARDYTCGPQTYNKHDGTDFAIRNLHAMRAGVAVLASAAGVVRATRDGMADGQFSRDKASVVKDRECGNGVLIEHEDGWQTQYCHMLSGSVAVRRGARVERGDKLGLVGLSGRTEFPHLHLTVRHRGRPMDPFTGRAAPSACGEAGETLWGSAAASALTYRPVSIYDAGVAGAAPSVAQINAGEGLAAAHVDSPVLVAWAAFYGVREGDEISLTLADPGGRTLAENRHRAERTQARRLASAGIRRGAASWSPGRYRLTVRVLRDGAAKPAAERVLTLELD
jgi:murein DD-endopeptidase MepM/ murein hydrolase activator NlpD